MAFRHNINKEETTIYGGSIIYKGSKTLQLDKGQDYVDQGHYIREDGMRVDWVVAFDGHGNDSCINVIRKANLSEIMTKENPAEELQKCIDESKQPSYMKLSSGATFICAKMCETDIVVELEISYAGDSTAIVIQNDQHIFTTDPHNCKNAKQMMQLIKKGVVSAMNPTTVTAKSFALVNSDTIISKPGEYINLQTDRETSGIFQISPASSLGHDGLYGGLDVDTVKFTFNKEDSIRVVLTSDGVTDVVSFKDKIFIEANSATNIIDYAYSRWRQTWNYFVEPDFSKMKCTKFPANGYDDCCAAMIDRKPYREPVPVPPVESQIHPVEAQIHPLEG